MNPVDIHRLYSLEEAALPAPWREHVLGSEGYAVLGPQGSRPGGHRLATPHVARCGHEAWEVDKADAELIAAMRNALPDLLAAAGELYQLSARLRRIATPTNVARLRLIGGGQKRHPDTTALFNDLAALLEIHINPSPTEENPS